MKKNKWLFNIITVVLCVCAMAIGVYAAKQASLTTTGQIGFKAHNCEVILNGTIDAYQSGGDTVLNKEQDIKTYTTTGGKITNVKIGGTGGVSTLELPAMYFSDTGTNGNTVTLNLTTANQSVFDVKAKISVTGDMPTGVTCAISEDNYVMGALNSTTDEKSFTITFTLSNPTTSADFGDTAFKVKMEFEKYVVVDTRAFLQRATKSNSYTGLEEGSVYVEMGSYNGTPLKWYAFAKDGEAFFFVNTLSDVKPGAYWFISEYMLGTSVFNKNSTGNDQTEVEYNGSVLQKAMIDLQANTTYNFSDSEIFDLITNRDLPSETYSTAGGNGTTSGSTGQKFWPLSYNYTDEGEWGLLSAHGSSISYSNCKTCTVGSTSSSSWWLRSPNGCSGGELDGGSFAYRVEDSGDVTFAYHPVNEANGIRPAFELVIV